MTPDHLKVQASGRDGMEGQKEFVCQKTCLVVNYEENHCLMEFVSQDD